MKAYILYNPQQKSLDYARACFDSFSGFDTWEPILFSGCNPTVLKEYDDKYNISDNRSKWEKDDERYESKKSCFYSHFELWLKVIENNAVTAIVEHDTRCIGDLPDNLKFNGAIQLCIESAARLKHKAIREKDYGRLIGREDGVHPMDISREINGYTPMISNMAYAITPEAAKILVDDCIKNGWYQNDELITTKYFDIGYILPSVIEYDKSLELGTSINYSWGDSVNG